MTRFNFQTPGLQTLDARGLGEIVPARLRPPAIALLAAIVAVAAVFVFEGVQLRAAESEYEDIAARRDRTQVAVRTVVQLRALVSKRTDTLVRITMIRRRDLDGTNELATIGNAVPTRAWIASLHSDGARWTIDGETRDPQAIGATLVALRRASMLRAPGLVSLRSSNAARPIDYQVNVERVP